MRSNSLRQLKKSRVHDRRYLTVDELPDLVSDGFDHLRMTVTGRRDPDT